MADLRVGFIGLGNMGRPMAANILARGYRLTVANRSRPPVDALAAEGAIAASTPSEVAAQADIVCLCLPLPSSVEEVAIGRDGILAGARPGSVLVDFSTVGPATCRTVAAALAERDVEYVDAPVSGGTTGAAAGTLTVMAGGSPEAYERATPILQAVGKTIIHAGPVGAGAVVKLMNQLLVGINLAGIAEAFVLGTRAGVRPELLYQTISTATGNSAQLQRNLPDLILKGDFAPMFSVDLLHKDLSLALELGKESRVRLLLGALTTQIVEEARELGFGANDIAAVIRPLERLAGLEVRATRGQG